MQEVVPVVEEVQVVQEAVGMVAQVVQEDAGRFLDQLLVSDQIQQSLIFKCHPDYKIDYLFRV